MKLLKWLGLLLVVVLILIVAVPIALINFLDPNDLKGMIADRVQQRTGRTLTIPGDIEIRFWPKLHIQTGELTLSNAAGFGDAPLFSAREMQIAVATMPLLKRRIEMDTIRVHGARIVLARNADGSANWDGIVKPSDEPAPLKLDGFIVGGVDIQDASITWSDASLAEPREAQITGLRITTGPLTFGAPIELNIAATARANKPALDADIALIGTVTYDLDNERYTLAPLNLDTTLRGERLPGGSALVTASAAVDIDLAAGTAIVRDLKLQGLDTEIAGTIEASALESVAPGVKGELNVVGKDLGALFRIAELQGSSQLRRLGDRAFSLHTSFDRAAGSSDIAVPDFTLKLLGADIAGNLNARNTDSDQPAIAGSITARGPDLPAVLTVLGQFQAGEDKPMVAAGRSLEKASDKAFDIAVQFDADLKSGKVSIDKLNARGLGYTVAGNLNAADINSPRGAVSGQLAVHGEPAGPLLAAFGNAGLGESIKTLQIDTGVSGTSSDLSLAPLSIKADVRGRRAGDSDVPLAISAGLAKANLDAGTFTLREVSVTGLGMNVTGDISGSNIKSTRDYAGKLNVAPFNLREALLSLNQEIPEMADPKTLTRFGMSADIDGAADRVKLDNLSMVLDESTLKGNLALNQFDNPAVDFGLTIDRLNADRYLPPKPPEGTPAAAPSEAAELPIELLRSLKARGDLSVGEMQYAGAKLQNVKLSINARDGLIELNPIAADLYRGSYEGTINLDARGEIPQLALKTSMTDVHVEPLLIDIWQEPMSPVAGRTSFTAALSSSGKSTEQLKRGMSGQATFNVADGVYRGVDIPAVLAQIEIMIESRRFEKLYKDGETPFSALSGTVDIQNGVAVNKDLVMLGSGFRVNGDGTLIDLNNDTMNYDLEVAVDKSRVAQADEDYNLGGYKVPIECRGAVAEPTCVPDASGIAKAFVTNVAKDLINDALQGKNVGKALEGLFGR